MSLFFLASKLAWLLISPDHLTALLIIIGTICLFCKAYKKATTLFVILTFLICGITFLPLGEWLSYPLEKRYPIIDKLPDSVDGVIVLGGAGNMKTSVQWKSPQVNQSAERFLTFIRLVKHYPEARHLFTSGSGNIMEQDFKGTDVGKALFKNQGLDINKILFESQSRNTHENGIYSFDLVQPKPDETWLLITSAFHMPRSVGVFEKMGWQVIPFPVDFNTNPDHLVRLTFNFGGNLQDLDMALHEWTGLIVYYLTGKTSHLFPGP